MMLTQDIIARLQHVRFVTPSKKRGQHKGSHVSLQYGSSLDFSDFRTYTPGDDVRQIDWHVYGRTQKHYIKRFLDEQELRIHVVLDTSLSMRDEAKWLFARQLVVALGCITLSHDDHFSYSYVGQGIPFRAKGSRFRHRLNEQVAQVVAQSNEPFTTTAHKALPKDRTVLFIITDGLEAMSQWEQFFQHVHRSAKDIRLLVIGTDDEQQPKLRGDVALRDIETNEHVQVSLTDEQARSYTARYNAHREQLSELCRRHQIGSLFLTVEQGITQAIFQTMRQARWVM